MAKAILFPPRLRPTARAFGDHGLELVDNRRKAWVLQVLRVQPLAFAEMRHGAGWNAPQRHLLLILVALEQERLVVRIRLMRDIRYGLTQLGRSALDLMEEQRIWVLDCEGAYVMRLPSTKAVEPAVSPHWNAEAPITLSTNPRRGTPRATLHDGDCPRPEEPHPVLQRIAGLP